MHKLQHGKHEGDVDDDHRESTSKDSPDLRLAFQVECWKLCAEDIGFFEELHLFLNLDAQIFKIIDDFAILKIIQKNN